MIALLLLFSCNDQPTEVGQAVPVECVAEGELRFAKSGPMEPCCPRLVSYAIREVPVELPDGDTADELASGCDLEPIPPDCEANADAHAPKSAMAPVTRRSGTEGAPDRLLADLPKNVGTCPKFRGFDLPFYD